MCLALNLAIQADLSPVKQINRESMAYVNSCLGNSLVVITNNILFFWWCFVMWSKCARMHMKVQFNWLRGDCVELQLRSQKNFPLTHLLLSVWVLVYGNRLGCHHVHCRCCKHWGIIESRDRWSTYTTHIVSVRLLLVYL